MFYAGIHYVNAYLRHTTGHVPDRHDDREQWAFNRMSRNVHNALRELRSNCDDARYKLRHPTPIDCDRLQQKLHTIEMFVRQVLPLANPRAH